MHTLKGLLPAGFSFPDTLNMPQTTAISGCRAWSATINPFPPQSPNTVFRGVAAVSANDVWAVGFNVQTPDDNTPILTLIEHWDGQSWQIIASPNPQPSGDNALFSVAAVNANDVWAVGFSGATPGARGFITGQTLIEHWDGTGWQVIPSPSSGLVSNSLESVAIVQADDIWAAGFARDTTNNPFHTLIKHWDGHTWQIIPSPNPESNSVIGSLAIVSDSDIWAVGFSSPSLNTAPFQTLTEHWDGKTWQVVPSPNTGSAFNELRSVAVISAHDIWAVGQASNTLFSSNEFDTTLVEHWDGHKWRVVASPNPGWGSNGLLAVAGISAHDVWAVGGYTNNLPDTLQGQTLVEHWNGHTWQVVPSESPGLLGNALSGITRVPETQTLWAVGQKGDTNQVLQPLAEFSC